MIVNSARAEAPIALHRWCVVSLVWIVCVAAVVLTGCLDGTSVGTLTALLVTLDAMVFTDGYLQ